MHRVGLLILVTVPEFGRREWWEGWVGVWCVERAGKGAEIQAQKTLNTLPVTQHS